MTKREQIIEIAYKALFEAFTVGTKESAFSAENSEYWSPHFEYDIAPKIADTILALDEQKENKTAEEILREHPDAPIISTSPTRRMLINDIIDAMKEYRQQPQNQGTDLPLVK